MKFVAITIILLMNFSATVNSARPDNSLTISQKNSTITLRTDIDNYRLEETNSSSILCFERCDTSPFYPDLPCQCNDKCVKYQDCCPDYNESCLTCTGRCEIPFDENLPCQCNRACQRYDDCCDSFCFPARVTDGALARFSEDILENDVNNVASLVTVNLQGKTCYSCSNDAAPQPLLSVRAEAYRKPTISKLLPLHNNYIPATGQAETVTNLETQEERDFLDALLTTSVMAKTQRFLLDKGLISTASRNSQRTNSRVFRDALHQIWFGLYSRENRTLGSSGFEHVFLGEVKDGKVSGFHNWVFFSIEEANNNLDYKGRIGSVVNLGAKGRIIKHKFNWENKEKPISSMFVGTSPEFEMALYTVCFYARPGRRCPVKLNGKDVNIQTHYFTNRGKKYVASAYPDI